MAYPRSHEQTTPKRNVENIYYTPSPTNASFGYLSIGAQNTISYTVTPPTPLVALPTPDSIRVLRPDFGPAHETRLKTTEEEGSVVGFIDWSAEGKWWIDDDVTWTGYVDYPISTERSSIAREAEHRIKAELETEKRRREKL